MSLSAADIFAAKPIVTKYDCPSLGEGAVVCAKQFNAIDRKAIVKFCGKDQSKAIVANIIYGICDEDGKRIFEESDLKKFDSMSEIVIAALFTAVTQSNKYDEKTVAKN